MLTLLLVAGCMVGLAIWLHILVRYCQRDDY